ncbi:MAG: hypothetical protein ACW987_19345 [Candidatus Thorarchaeota archaeon]|jgi:hypothetical protein
MANNESDLIAAFIARNGVTTCKPSNKQARSLRAMRRDEEVACLKAEYGALFAEDTSDAETDAEQEAELRAERFGSARACGLSMEDSLDAMNG